MVLISFYQEILLSNTIYVSHYMKNIWLIASLILKNFALTVDSHVHHCILMVLFSLYQAKLSGHTIWASHQMKNNWLAALLILKNFALTVNAAWVHHCMLMMLFSLYQEIF